MSSESRVAQVTPQRAARTRGIAIGIAVAGPALIVGCVLLVLHDFAFGGLVTNRHPDVLAMWLPTFCFLGKTIAGGHVPAWDPHVMGGLPFAADPQSGWGYLPAMLVFALVPCSRAIRWFIVLQPILAGLGIYWFLRSEGLSRIAATVGGLSLAMAIAGSHAAIELPLAGAVAWTTLTLAAASRLMHARSWSRRLGWTTGTAVAWGQIGEAHLSQGFLIGSAAIVAYLIARRIAQRKERSTRETLLTAGLLAVAVLLVNLAVFLPRFLYLRHSTLAFGYARLSYSAGGSRTGRGAALPPSWPVGFSASPGAYLGGAALILTFAGWRNRRARPLFIGFAAYAAVFFVLSLTSVAKLLEPVLDSTRLGQVYLHAPERLRFAVLLATAVLAGLGVDGLRSARTSGERAILLAPGVVVWAIAPQLVGLHWPALRVLVVGMGAASLIVALAGRWRVLLALLPVVLAAELVASGLLGQTTYTPALSGRASSFIAKLGRPTIDAAAYVRQDAFIRTIRQSGLGRFATLFPFSPGSQTHGCILTASPNQGFLGYQRPPCWSLLANQRSMLFGLEDVGGYNPVQLPRYWSLIRRIDVQHIRYNAAFLNRLTPAAVELMQIRWAIEPAGVPPPMPGAVAVASEKGFDLYRIAPDIPRASVYTSWRIVPDPDLALGAVTGASSGTLNQQVVLEGLVPGLSGPPAPAVPAQFRWTASGSASITVHAARPGVLLVRNSYDPNWHASVDGRPAQVLPADEVDQGVHVPAGRHTVLLTYDDPAIAWGVVGSVLALAALLGAAQLFHRRERADREAIMPEPDVAEENL